MNGRHFNQLAATAAAGYKQTVTATDTAAPPRHLGALRSLLSLCLPTFCGKSKCRRRRCGSVRGETHKKLPRLWRDATTVVVTFGPHLAVAFAALPLAALPPAPLQHLKGDPPPWVAFDGLVSRRPPPPLGGRELLGRSKGIFRL